MNKIVTSVLKTRRVAAVALAVTAIPCIASTASAAPRPTSTHAKRAIATKPVASLTTAATTMSTSAATTATTTSATATPTVTSVHSIGGYVFYNVTYAEAVDLWLAAVAAAPAGYTPPPIYSVSATTTVSGTVTDPVR